MENNNTNLSIIIRCSDDWNVFKCIESIDIDAEIIVSLTPNKEIEEKLTAMNIKWCNVPKGNLSLTSNGGFNLSTKQYVLDVDSDTYFAPNSLKHLCDALKTHPIVRMNLMFKNDRAKFSKIVANARRFVFLLPLAFTPGLAINKSIINKIDGFYFNNEIPFAADSDINFRRYINKIPVYIEKRAILYHGNTPIKHDLKASFRIGQGVFKISYFYKTRNNFPMLKSSWILKAVKPPHYYYIYKFFGISNILYQFIWDFIFWMGYFWQLLKTFLLKNDR